MRAVLEALQDGEVTPSRVVIDRVRAALPPTEFELGAYPSQPGIQRFDTIVRFKTIGPMKAGWLIKTKTGWQITDEGRAALERHRDPLDIARASSVAYQEWKRERVTDSDDSDSDSEVGDGTPEDDGVASVTLEQAEETAWAEIESYLRRMPPYPFQELVAALLEAMGYHVAWVSPPGKDGGVDILAYTDPLGATGPRIKVQVKRHNTGSTSVGDLRSFLAVLGPQDVGIYVATNGFTSDARAEARSQETRRLTLVDLPDLFELWVQHYGNLPEREKDRLPLRQVHFLAPS